MDGSFLLVSSSGYEMLFSFLGTLNFFSSTKFKKPFFFMAWIICTHTHRIYIVNKINEAESFLRSWRSLSQLRSSSPLLRPKVNYVAHNSLQYMRTCVTSCNTQVLQLTNCETLGRTNTIFLKRGNKY